MTERDTYYPNEENLGRNCMFWSDLDIVGCSYPKMELQGRTSCEGIIDDVCLFVKDGREPISLSSEQQLEIKTRRPDMDENTLPPGEPI